MAELRLTVLGCGSSGGVPRLGGLWGNCDPSNPKNRRRRCSVLFERETPAGVTRALIDTSPDLREQLLDANVGLLDGVLFTHSHADHVHGLDDLRMVVFNRRARLPVWADAPTQADLFARFAYAFIQPEGSDYPPILEMNAIEPGQEVVINGDGGEIRLRPFEVEHGRIVSLGFRVGNMAYLPDASAIPETTWAELADLDHWVVDALRRTPHVSHAHLERTLEWIARAKPRKAYLTNMHIDMDYDAIAFETPDGVMPAYDGLTITTEI